VEHRAVRRLAAAPAVALDAALEALALVTPTTSTISPAANSSTVSAWPTS